MKCRSEILAEIISNYLAPCVVIDTLGSVYDEGDGRRRFIGPNSNGRFLACPINRLDRLRGQHQVVWYNKSACEYMRRRRVAA
jgi:hypothetical protein